ncbi:MAG: hypothetical protein Q8Q12_08080 [bacterium]|nr:hypothetical protein [bacterium]
MNDNAKYRLKFKHKDFICKQLALFKPHRQVAEELLSQFPEIPLSLDQLVSRVQYYSTCRRRTERWFNRTRHYRRMLEYDAPNRFRLVNKHQRLMELERIFDEAMTPKLRRIVWFPVSKATDGSVTYGQKEVYGPDLRAAIAALHAVPHEIDEASFLYYKPPGSLQDSRIRDYEGEFLKKALRKLDLTFGLK